MRLPEARIRKRPATKRESDRDFQPSAATPTVQLDLRVVALRDVSHDGEAQAAAGTVARLYAIEAVEHAGTLVRWNARAAVLYAEHRPPVLEATATSTRPPDGV